mgnify:FL=1
MNNYDNVAERKVFLDNEYNRNYLSNLLKNRVVLLDTNYFDDLKKWIEKSKNENEKNKRIDLYYYVIDRLDSINDSIKAKNPIYVKSMIELFLSKEIKNLNDKSISDEQRDKLFSATSEVFKLIQQKINELKGV